MCSVFDFSSWTQDVNWTYIKRLHSFLSWAHGVIAVFVNAFSCLKVQMEIEIAKRYKKIWTLNCPHVSLGIVSSFVGSNVQNVLSQGHFTDHKKDADQVGKYKVKVRWMNCQLAHFSTMFHFYNLWKLEKTYSFWHFQGVQKCKTGLKWVNAPNIALNVFNVNNINNGTTLNISVIWKPVNWFG